MGVDTRAKHLHANKLINIFGPDSSICTTPSAYLLLKKNIDLSCQLRDCHVQFFMVKRKRLKKSWGKLAFIIFVYMLAREKRKIHNISLIANPIKNISHTNRFEFNL